MIGRRLPFGWTAEFIASPAFLQTYQWARARYEALRVSKGRCELCGRGKPEGVWIEVDHIKGRHSHPHLALELSNLQVLCGDSPIHKGCNAGKGRKYQDDWRSLDHPHRPISLLTKFLR